MKNLLLIVLFFFVVLPVAGQKHKNSPTESYLQEKDTSFVPKTPKNEFLCDFELLLSAGGVYKRKITNKIAIGASFSLGFPIVFFWNNRSIEDPKTNLEKLTQNAGIEIVRIGLIFTYDINKNLVYEFNPLFSNFSLFAGTGEGSLNFYTARNSIFLKLKRYYIGTSISVGIASGDFDKDWAIYNSLIILRVPLKH